MASSFYLPVSSSIKPNNISNYNWLGVLQFLQTQYLKLNQKQNQFLLEKNILDSKIAELQGELKSIESINKDLMKRNKMLEFSLKQQKFKNNIQKQQDKQQNLEIIPKRKPKNNRQMLSKILLSLGIKDFLQSEQDQLSYQKQKKQSQNKNLIDKIKHKIQQKQIIHQKQVSFTNHCLLKGHLDSVRQIFFTPNNAGIVSIGQDCIIKCWDVQRIKKAHPNEAIQSYLSIRQHSDPIYTIIGSQVNDESDKSNNLVFTAGHKGLINCFYIPKNKQEILYPHLRGAWKNTQDKADAIWQLLYDNITKQLISSASDSTIKLYQTRETYQNSEIKQVKGVLKKTYKYKFRHQDDVPTAILIIQKLSNILAAGYVKSNCLALFDKQTAKVISSINVSQNQQKTVAFNRMINCQNLIAAAHQDNYIRLYDPSSNKIVKQWIGHKDAVSSICMAGNLLATGSHDGYIKIWDPKNWKQVFSWQGHKRKYEQSIHGISEKNGLFGSCGADGIIKIMSRQ